MTSKEALEKLRLLAVNSESDLTNFAIAREYTSIIEKDLKFLEILKREFYIRFNIHNWGSYIDIVGKTEYDQSKIISDCVACSDFIENNEQIEFLENYLKEIE